MMQDEKFFIRVLSDHISGRPSSLDENIDWGNIYRLSKMHQVEGIVYYQCKDFLPESVHDLFEQASSATLYLNVNRRFAMQKIISGLNAADILFSVVKGFSVAQYYLVPDLRTMGDCDIVVRPSDVCAAGDIFYNAGFQKVNEYMQHEWAYRKNDILIELHDVLVREDEYTTPSQKSFFSNYAEYIKDGNLDWSFHFLYLLMHLRKHLIKNGAGIRQFMDVAVIIQSKVELKWDWIIDVLKELNLIRFANACFDLISFWFGIEAEGRQETLDTAFKEKVTQKILLNGVFGFSDKNNSFNIEKNNIVMGNSPRWVKRMKALHRSIFLPYEKIKKIPEYKYLENKRYLMLFGWIHRFGRVMLKKDKSSTHNTLKSFGIKNSELNERKEYLTQMGLMCNAGKEWEI